MSRDNQPPLTRAQVRALLVHYRVTGHAAPTDEQVAVWLSDLRGYSAGEAHAALTTMQADHHGRVTTADVVARIERARTTPASPRGAAVALAVPLRRDHRERVQAKAAGVRGIRAVYAAMGWQRHPDHEAARRVSCAFCKARPGEVCAPMTRNRAGQRQERDPASRMHPARVAAARAQPASTPVENCR